MPSSSEQFSVVRVDDPDNAAVAESLFREYGNWAVGRLATHHGIRLSEATVESAHAQMRAELLHLLGGRGRLLMAKADLDPVGVALLKPVDGELAEMKRVYVKPEARRHGVGRTLVQRLLGDAGEEGFARVRLETLAFMTDAHGLYRTLGFRETGPFVGSEGEALGLGSLTTYMVLDLNQ